MLLCETHSRKDLFPVSVKFSSWSSGLNIIFPAIPHELHISIPTPFLLSYNTEQLASTLSVPWLLYYGNTSIKKNKSTFHSNNPSEVFPATAYVTETQDMWHVFAWVAMAFVYTKKKVEVPFHRNLSPTSSLNSTRWERLPYTPSVDVLSSFELFNICGSQMIYSNVLLSPSYAL